MIPRNNKNERGFHRKGKTFVIQGQPVSGDELDRESVPDGERCIRMTQEQFFQLLAELSEEVDSEEETPRE